MQLHRPNLIGKVAVELCRVNVPITVRQRHRRNRASRWNAIERINMTRQCTQSRTLDSHLVFAYVLLAVRRRACEQRKVELRHASGAIRVIGAGAVVASPCPLRALCLQIDTRRNR